MGSVAQEPQGQQPSPMLASLLAAEVEHESALAAARAEAERIVEEARQLRGRDDEALAREIDELRRGAGDRLEAARSKELPSLLEQGNARAAAFARLASERAAALAEDVVRQLLEGGAP
ncbi:MAG TPA: hypothetical protein VFP52_17195 [Myxococcales bacterium]|nr:hypothetical protein [Myxococcales bacterium]HET9754711.1 hypothetical protein [Myxococcales bacterium]